MLKHKVVQYAEKDVVPAASVNTNISIAIIYLRQYRETLDKNKITYNNLPLLHIFY